MDHVPRLVFWELTKKCNLNCIHCRAEADSANFTGELELPEIRLVIDDIKQHYNPILVLTGGEPLYRPDIFEIATYASGRGMRVALATNGTLIAREVAASIRDSGILRVSVSLDGSGAESHDGFRGIRGAFEKAMNGIRFLREAGVEFQINTTVTRRNVDSLEDIIRLAEREGAKALHIFMLVPVGCGIEIAASEMLSREKYEDVLNWFYDRSRDTALELRATCAPHYYRILRQRAREEGRTVTPESDGMAAMTRGCLAGSGVCFISHRGDVQPCGYLPIKVGNVRETPFHKIWEESEVFRNLRDTANLTGKCGACEYRAWCGGCRARAYYENGNYCAEEPYCVYVPARMKG
ncbi:MAG: heme b synthase [Spirochaetes bacterium]|nr:heme b synthase [Spirochaetota bacterium]